MKVVYLGNGSTGNSTYYSDGTTSILVDNGLALKRIPFEVNGGILITHSHVDHCDGVDRYMRKYRAKNGISCIVDRSFSVEHRIDPSYLEYKDFISGDEFYINTISVKPIGLWHDEPCFAFLINKEYLHLTDTGHIPFTIEHHLKNNPIKLFYVESNYDEEYIEESDYDAFLKYRIKSRHGHLSNQHVISYLNKHVDLLRSVEKIAIGHLSDNTNTEERVEELLKSNLNPELLEKVVISKEGTTIDI